MFNKRGVVEEPLVGIPALILLGMILLGFILYAWGCTFVSAIGYCGAKPVDVSLDTLQVVSSARLVTFLQTPVVVEINGADQKVVLGDVLVKAYQALPSHLQKGESPTVSEREAMNADQFVAVYLYVVGNFIEKEKPFAKDASWNMRIMQISENKVVQALAVPADTTPTSKEYLQQSIVLPLENKQGALKVELFLTCSECSDALLRELN